MRKELEKTNEKVRKLKMTSSSCDKRHCNCEEEIEAVKWEQKRISNILWNRISEIEETCDEDKDKLSMIEDKLKGVLKKLNTMDIKQVGFDTMLKDTKRTSG